MPGNLSRIASSLAKVTPITSIASKFGSNAVQQSRGLSDSATQAKVAQETAAPSSTVQQVSNYQNNLKGISSWSKGVTDQVRAGNMAKRAAENARVSQASQLGQVQRQLQGMQGASVQPVQMNFTGPVSGARAQLVKQATSMLGTPYAWGGGGYGIRSSRGTGKGTQNVIGVDCSGLTSYVYSTLGIRLPRTARGQLSIGYKTAVSNLRPGDLVVWNNGSHTSMYLGNGQIIESPDVGKTVRIRKLRPGEAVTGIHLSLAGD